MVCEQLYPCSRLQVFTLVTLWSSREPGWDLVVPRPRTWHRGSYGQRAKESCMLHLACSDNVSPSPVNALCREPESTGVRGGVLATGMALLQ